LSFRLLTRSVIDLFDVSDNISYTFVSGLAGLIDIRVMIGVADSNIKIGVQEIILLGTDQPRITLGAYN
jgi:hypothetical protein